MAVLHRYHYGFLRAHFDYMMCTLSVLTFRIKMIDPLLTEFDENFRVTSYHVIGTIRLSEQVNTFGRPFMHTLTSFTIRLREYV